MTTIKGKQIDRQSAVHILIGILVFGSIWGLSEVVLGGSLRAAQLPYKGGLLTGMGIGIMGIALALYKKPVMLIGIGIIAASIKLLASPICSLPVGCLANSCVAVLLEALTLSVVAFAMMKTDVKNVYAQIGAGASGAFIASILFWLIGMHVVPCQYLLSFMGAPGRWMFTEGLLWAAFSGLLLPSGYLAGAKLRAKVTYGLTIKPQLAYASAAAVFVFCLGTTVVALMAGL